MMAEYAGMTYEEYDALDEEMTCRFCIPWRYFLESGIEDKNT
jgi:hypothetical protein